MSEKGLYSPVIRRIVTIVILFSIIGSFIAVYYLVYVPQAKTLYNLRNFRILHEISGNFKDRIDNYGKVYSSRYVSNKDQAIQAHVLNAETDSADFDFLFRSSFRGDPKINEAYQSEATIVRDSVQYHIYKTTDSGALKKPDANSVDTTVVQSLGALLKPVLSVHLATFESFLLIKQSPYKGKSADNIVSRYDSILYKTDNSYIANINTDSLFKNKNIQAPVISDLDIEGITYKMFLFPFKINSNAPDTYVLAGIVTDATYNGESQSVPVDLLATLCFILVVLLLALPFMKVFFLSAEETITLRDVRTIILVIYVVPVFITLLCSSIWMLMYTDKLTVNTLQNLQNNIQQNFYREINQTVLQMRDYDHLIMNAYQPLDTTIQQAIHSRDSQQQNNTDLKDIVFYPKEYKGFTSLHWMDKDGVDIAAWNWNNLPATYFNLSDRQYFKDIKYNRGFVLPNAPPGIDTVHFSIQPVLSRLTGEFTVNIAKSSTANIIRKTKNGSDSAVSASAIGLSGKMYSIWNVVKPKGYAFCLVDESGQIIAHSDTARSLQENIFEESSDSLLLRNIINHKDSVLLDDVNLYDESVRMIIKPLPGLPYYLVTYCDKRSEYLFMFHVLAFVFVCISALLLLLSLFSYLMMISGKKMVSLLYKNNDHDWLKPSPDKKYYYIKIILQSSLVAFIVWGFSEAFNNDTYILYSVNMAVLLPLFTVTGYYLIKKSRDYFESHTAETKSRLITTKSFNIEFRIPCWKEYLRFGKASGFILALYTLSALLFLILQNALFINQICSNTTAVISVVSLLLIIVPVIMFWFAGITIFQWDKKTGKTGAAKAGNRYVTLFIVSLLFSVLLISVIPALTFLNYAFREEKTLQVQSLQIDLAKKIQQRRLSKNPLWWQTKINTPPFGDSAKSFLYDIKFSGNKGIYLLDCDRLDTVKTFGKPAMAVTSCSPLYKKITRYLFLPPDHDEFYDDASHNSFYYWQYSANKKGNDLLDLFYKNTSDNKDPSAIRLTSTLPHAALFQDFTKNDLGWLVILMLVVFVFLFYSLILSTTKRIFLIGFFKAEKGADEDTGWLQKCYEFINLGNLSNNLFDANQTVSFALIREKENEKEEDESNSRDGKIIHLHISLTPVYETIWNKLSDVEKFTLYDFATDGFTNYKQLIVLYGLLKKGLLVIDENNSLTIMTQSFRNFLITKETAPEIKKLSSEGKQGSWGLLRTVFYVILLAVAIFTFMSQEEASKRLITIISSLGALLPAILKMFDKSTFSSPPASGGK